MLTQKVMIYLSNLIIIILHLVMPKFTLNSDGTFTYQHDGSNNIYDTIYVEVCDIPSIGTTPCCQPILYL